METEVGADEVELSRTAVGVVLRVVESDAIENEDELVDSIGDDDDTEEAVVSMVVLV